MNLFEYTFLGFDTETTGVSTRKDRIVEAALVKRTFSPADSGSLFDAFAPHVIPADAGISSPGASHYESGYVNTDERFTWLINPGIEIPESASAVHGITTERAVAEGADPVVALDEIATQIAYELNKGGYLVIYNAAYDLPLFSNELMRNGLKSLEERIGGPVMNVIDPLVLDRAFDKYRKGKRTLIAALAAYGFDVSDSTKFHGAEFDTVSTLDLLKQMAYKFEDKFKAIADSAELFALQSKLHEEWAQSMSDYIVSKGGEAFHTTKWITPREPDEMAAFRSNFKEAR